MSAEKLLSRLDNVRESGKGRWAARCPAHEDKSPSLSIAELPDGRVLVNCFAGCGAIDVLESLGLSWVDVFPHPLQQEERQRIPASWALEVLARESLIVGIVAADIAAGRAISETDSQRVAQAAGRIATIAERAHGG